MSPSDEMELKNMVMTCAAFNDGPTVLRYPRGVGYGAEKLQSLFGYELENGEIPAKGEFFELAIALHLKERGKCNILHLICKH
jgi:1-deoxy-D-xylulose-5-phosphate synthase